MLNHSWEIFKTLTSWATLYSVRVADKNEDKPELDIQHFS